MRRVSSRVESRQVESIINRGGWEGARQRREEDAAGVNPATTEGEEEEEEEGDQ